jgi:hypothetical protein
MRCKLKVKLFLCLMKHGTIETWGLEMLLLHAFLISTLYGVDSSGSRSGHLTGGLKAPIPIE